MRGPLRDVAGMLRSIDYAARILDEMSMIARADRLLAVKRVLMVGALAVGLWSGVGGCALDAAAICKASGGTQAGGTCTQFGPRQQAARESCKASGGVYLVGSDTCVLGSGGP